MLVRYTTRLNSEMVIVGRQNIIYTCNMKLKNQQVHQLSGLAYIPTCQSPSPQNTNSLQHWPSPSKWRPVSHTTDGLQMSSQVCRTRLTTVERVIHFQFLTSVGLPLGQSSPKGELTYYPPRSTILQNFSPIVQTVYEICITKVVHFG